MKKKIVIGLAVVAGIAVLAGAAYLAMNLMAPGRAETNSLGVLPAAGGKGLGYGGKVTVKIELAPAPELPQSPPDVRGRLIETKDNSLTVGTFAENPAGVSSSTGGATGGDNGPSTTTEGNNTPSTTTEVVITQDTKIYRDATFDAMKPPTDGKIQQKVEPYSLAQAAKDGVDSVTAWGAKRGDRLIADVVVLGRSVVFIQKSGKP